MVARRMAPAPHVPHWSSWQRYYKWALFILYRDHLNTARPADDLAWRIRWAASKFKRPGEPLFLLVFGGLGLYGGHADVFSFLSDVMASVVEGGKSADSGLDIVAVGAQEMARLAQEWGISLV